ncbi:MAG: hypothetical protein AB1426_04635 [Bacillota bacterium]
MGKIGGRKLGITEVTIYGLPGAYSPLADFGGGEVPTPGAILRKWGGV